MQLQQGGAEYVIQSLSGPVLVRSSDPDLHRILKGYLYLAITALFFGSAPTFARLAFQGGTDPLSLQVFRFVITAGATWLAVAVLRHLPRIRRDQIGRLGLLAICTAVSSLCYMTSVRYIPVGVASLTFFTFPLIVGPLSHVMKLDRLTRRSGIAILVSFSGLCLVLGYDLSLDWRGLGLAFAAGVSVAVSFVVSRPLTRMLPPLTITAFATGIPCLFFVAFGLASGALVFPQSAVGGVGVVLNGLCFAIGLAFLYASIGELGATRTAVLINLEPLVSIAAAFLVLGQTIGTWQALGAAVVVGGIVLMQTGRRDGSAR